MIIGLMGTEFESENKGCEALSYSILNILKDIQGSDITIYYFSNLEYGKVPEYFPTLNLKKINLKIKDCRLTFFRAARQCDFIFDATMGDSFSDIYSKDVCLSDIRFKRIASTLCRNYVLLPQTYGPFYDSNVKRKASYVLKKTKLVFCRDSLSQEFVRENVGIENSIVSSDMAFALPYKKNMYSLNERKKIGINVSGLLYKGGFTKNNQFNLKINYIEFINKLIEDLLNRYSDYDIYLIPHVINLSENAHDDDYKVCFDLHKKYPQTILSPIFSTPIEAKSYISNMDIFIGSRMHATIASFSSGVVTIPISYSRKFEGLFGSLDYPYVIDAKEETTDSAHKLVIKYIEESFNLKKVQDKSLQLIKEINDNFKNSILELINGEN